jgi:tetratricopeptide (TPR) repeat protein
MTLMKLRDIFKDRNTSVFIASEQDYDNELNWSVEPTHHELIPAEEDYYFVKALEVSQTGETHCYLGFMTPERIATIVVKEDSKGQAYVEGIYQQENSVIPAVACDFSGYYGIYYAKENPQIGIDVLKSGLAKATHKSAVAEDLGYILIDEERSDEAIEAFKISEQNTPSTQYTFLELAKLYEQRGEMDKQAEYMGKFKNYRKVDT